MPNRPSGVCLLLFPQDLDNPLATVILFIQDLSALVHSHCIAALPDRNLQLFHNAVVKALFYIIMYCICSILDFNHQLSDSILAANSVTKSLTLLVLSYCTIHLLLGRRSHEGI